MKKHTAPALIAAISLLLCGCGQIPEIGRESEAGITEETGVQTDQSHSDSNIKRPAAEAPFAAVKESIHTRTAVDFIYDFYATLATHDDSILLLNKYFDDGGLKNRMGECKERLLKNNDFFDKHNFDIDYAAAISDKETEDGVHYITVAYSYNYRHEPYDPTAPEEGWSGSGMMAPFAVKGGKIVNFAVDGFFEALPPGGNIPEVQIVTSHITKVFTNGNSLRLFELDGVGYEHIPDSKSYDCVMEDGGFLKLVTSEGEISLGDYSGESDGVIEALKSIYISGSSECIGNTGAIHVDGFSFYDAKLYTAEENNLLLMGTETEAENNADTACIALLLRPCAD
ncbi:MAG: hypothetical protein NC203_04905 [Firmicutes bacterium]|nr:hypothetical protein [[Eubacterium] siraeum]MCM1487689.1 hypothetical protein [Bacillota bacterium]